VVGLSAVTTFLFIYANPNLNISEFFLKGGLLLLVTAIFMIVLIRTRYDLTLKEIKARLALEASNNEIQKQAIEIERINSNLEQIVHERTQSLEKKNAALEEYAFINAHKLRSPVASILGLINILTTMNLGKEESTIKMHLEESAKKLDDIVGDITKVIEKGDEA
jgi:signal transduction histidine kinase